MILGILLAICLAYLIVGLLVNKSNNKGDSKAEFKNFSEAPISYVKKADRIDKKLKIKDMND